jgi:ubiquitin carboxyl-terminal hydrolase L5
MAEWCTIESDPGVFTELIKNIGVKGVQVDEVVDLDSLESNTDQVYGLIFLFKYMRNNGYTPQVLSHWDDDLFFAKQVVNNACATQAILGVLMNNSDKIDIGDTLKELKSFSNGMDPYTRGMCISNSEKIKIEHNKFSRPEPFIFTKTKVAEDGDDVFHFVAYIHFKNSIYEIDGLREGPILIKENVKNEEWIKNVKPEIINRINLYSSNEIKFNLLAIVPNRLEKAKELEKEFVEKRNYIQNLINGGDVKMDEKFSDYNKLNKEDLEKSLKDFNEMIQTNKIIIQDEEEKINKFKLENERRQFNYIPLIFELLKLMSEKGSLAEIYDEAKKIEEAKVQQQQKK